MDCGLIVGNPFSHHRHLHSIGCSPSEVGLSSSLPSSSFIPTCIVLQRDRPVIVAAIKLVHSHVHSVMMVMMVSHRHLPVLCISSPVPTKSSSLSRRHCHHSNSCTYVISFPYVSLLAVLRCRTATTLTKVDVEMQWLLVKRSVFVCFATSMCSPPLPVYTAERFMFF